MASTVATIEMTPASLSSGTGPDRDSSMNSSETKTAHIPLAAAMSTFMANLPD
jgi:hypothetical protein